MPSRSFEQMTETSSFIYKVSGDRVLGTVSGRSLRRAADRKQRLEAKKLAKQRPTKI